MLVQAAQLFDGVRRVREPQMCARMFVRQLDTLLIAVGRGRSAIDIAIGERLDALSIGDRAMDLSDSSVGDYARERLGIAASTAEKLARLARALRERPLLREAVRSVGHGAVAGCPPRPRDVDAELLRLIELRMRRDEVCGHLEMLFVRVKGWDLLDFASLDHYAEERLGMCRRAVQQRASLEPRSAAGSTGPCG